MPEGPEVTRVSRDLNTYLKNKTLININILPGSKYVKKAPNNYKEFIDKLPLKIEGVKNKGKLIYFSFEKHNYMLNHLIMTGFWGHEKGKYTSLEFVLENDDKIYFCDARKFGFVDFLDSKRELDIKLSELGPDFLNDDEFDEALFTKILRKRNKSNISTVLMNQKIISGIGNYLKSEILYAARINPHRSVASLTEENINKIYTEGRRIIKASYRLGGTSKKDYVHLDGSKGNFQDFLKVYGKKEDKLGNKIIAEKTKDGRTTYWVPNLQN